MSILNLLALCMLGNSSCFCCVLFFCFFQKLTFRKIISGILSECQTVWIHVRTNILSLLTWVQTVHKDYKQLTKVAASKERAKIDIIFLKIESAKLNSKNERFTNQIKAFCRFLANFRFKRISTKLGVLNLPLGNLGWSASRLYFP